MKLFRGLTTAAIAPVHKLWAWSEQSLGVNPLLPPPGLRRTYYRTYRPGAYWKACDNAKLELVSRGLLPDHRVLDIGCGIGNLAVALTTYLEGKYLGFDVNREAIEWCRSAIAKRWPHFTFAHVDLASVAYHRHGKSDASTFAFPLGPQSVDYAFAGSVFTHLLPPAAEQYVRECGRVMAPGGVCIASFFLLDASRRLAIDQGRSFMSFRHALPAHRGLLHDPEVPEAAVAFDESWVTERLNDAGLEIVDIRRGGWWHGHDHDQDVVTAVRRS